MIKTDLFKLTLATGFFAVMIAAAGCNKKTDATTPLAPSVQTVPVITYLTATSAQAGGLVTSLGSDLLTADGIVYSSTSQTPTIANSVTGSGTTYVYANTMSGLTAGTTYYARAYATSSAGTSYGDVVKFTTSLASADTTTTVTTLAGSGTAGLTNGTGTSATFYYPQGIAVDASGNAYVSDSFNHLIRKVTPLGVVTTFAGNGSSGFTAGTTATASFYSPQGIAADAAGNIYVADEGNNAVYKVSTTNSVSILAGGGTAGFNDATGAAALFSAPQGIAVDASGNVYVADKNNNRIRKITPAGVVTTFAGRGVAGNLDGVADSACFKRPTGVAVDAAGNVYVADQGNYAIRKITPGRVVSTLIGNTLLPAYLNSPTGIAIDAAKNIFITDQTGRILEISSANVLNSIAGKKNTYGFSNGTNANAQFNSPTGIAVDASKNIYVTDYNNHQIRKLTIVTR